MESSKEVYLLSPYKKQIDEEINLFFAAVKQRDLDGIKNMLEQGFSPNTIIEDVYKQSENKNLALYLIDTDWSENALNVVDLLIDFGLDINHTDAVGNGILVYLMDYLSWWDFPEDIEEKEIINKFELKEVIRLRQTFDKVMKKKPSLALGEVNSDARNLFDFAEDGGCLHWFSPYEDEMNEDNKELFMNYRLAALLGN